jgi:hypothetical protein
MEFMLRATIAVLGLGIGVANAGDGDGQSADTLFSSIQNRQAVAARTVSTQTPTVGDHNPAAAVQAYDDRSQGLGAWLLRVFSSP